MATNQLTVLSSAKEFCASATKLKNSGQTMMGLDFGIRKIGLALSDQTFTIASPYEVYRRISLAKDVGYLIDLIKKFKVCIVVVGLPLKLDNVVDADLQNAINGFLGKLGANCPNDLRPYLYMQDERFSTSRSIHLLKLLGFNRQQSRDKEDKIAAAYILQDALDYLG